MTVMEHISDLACPCGARLVERPCLRHTSVLDDPQCWRCYRELQHRDKTGRYPTDAEVMAAMAAVFVDGREP
jgi:hypothetical protein